mmetsp:Transcript_70053/g.194672  ORF Transcript_70053/g.194672 Transcript_70053/m.194672 type:complete len:219 (+) Transcript_70053:306-962(+)
MFAANDARADLRRARLRITGLSLAGRADNTAPAWLLLGDAAVTWCPVGGRRDASRLLRLLLAPLVEESPELFGLEVLRSDTAMGRCGNDRRDMRRGFRREELTLARDITAGHVSGSWKATRSAGATTSNGSLPGWRWRCGGGVRPPNSVARSMTGGTARGAVASASGPRPCELSTLTWNAAFGGTGGKASLVLRNFIAVQRHVNKLFLLHDVILRKLR